MVKIIIIGDPIEECLLPINVGGYNYEIIKNESELTSAIKQAKIEKNKFVYIIKNNVSIHENSVEINLQSIGDYYGIFSDYYLLSNQGNNRLNVYMCSLIDNEINLGHAVFINISNDVDLSSVKSINELPLASKQIFAHNPNFLYTVY